MSKHKCARQQLRRTRGCEKHGRETSGVCMQINCNKPWSVVLDFSHCRYWRCCTYIHDLYDRRPLSVAGMLLMRCKESCTVMRCDEPDGVHWR